MAIPPTDVRGRGASYICTIANVLGKNLQGDGLGVVPLLSLDYSTARLKNGGEGQESVAVEIRNRLRLRRAHGHSRATHAKAKPHNLGSTKADQAVNKRDFFMMDY